MKVITWKIKDSWTETAKNYPDNYTEYQFGWITFQKLFPDVPHFFGFHLDIPGRNYSICNFKRIDWQGVFTKNTRFYLRIDLFFGGWFITVRRPDLDHYKSVEIVSITDFFGKELSR